jgi:pimeloyl-ACP methyl ester carboxylesterase
MPETTLNGWRIHYEEAGSGPPVFLVHGLLMDHTMFEHQVASLKDRYRVVTPDLRNHGESEKKAEDHTQWDCMEDHIALCDELGIDRAVFGGVSQGGFQSLRAALKHSDRVEGLVLIDTQAGPEDKVRAPMYEAFAQVVAEHGWNEDILISATNSMFGESASEELKRHWMKRWEKYIGAEAPHTMGCVSRREDITDRLGEIQTPAIVIHGEEDVAIEMSKAEELAEGLPNLVEFVKVPHAGHSSTVEQPEALTEAVERFLEKVWPPGADS